MSLELLRETVRINRVIGENSAQTIVENDIIVPDVKPDIAQILLMDGEAVVNSSEAMHDKILVNGSIRYKILYVSDEPEKLLKSINTSSNFSCELEMDGIRHGMKCKAKCDIEHIEHEILNGRKVNAKAVINVNGKASEENEQDIVYDVNGIEDVQVLKDNISLNSFIGSSNENCVVKENLELPAGKPAMKEILRNDVKISGKDYKIADNKVIAKGELNVSTLYIGDDETQSIQVVEHEVPFTQFIELQGVNADAICDIDYKVSDMRFEAVEDSDGELRLLGCEVVVEVAAEGYSRKNIEIVSDAYSPKSVLDIEKGLFVVEEPVNENKSQVIVKDNVVVDDNAEDIAEVFNVLCKPIVTDVTVEDDKVIVEGISNNNVLYLANSENQPVFCSNQQTPFKHVVDMKGVKKDMGCNVSVDVEHCNYSMLSQKEVEVRIVIAVSIKTAKQMNCDLISKINEQPIDNKKIMDCPSITIYFAQPGDTLWKVAKKYFITIDDIKKVNSLEDREQICPGQQILIPRKIS